MADNDVWPVVGTVWLDGGRGGGNNRVTLRVRQRSKWLVSRETVVQVPCGDDDGDFIDATVNWVSDERLEVFLDERAVTPEIVQHILQRDEITLHGEDIAGKRPSEASASQILGVLDHLHGYTAEVTDFDDIFRLVSADPSNPDLLLTPASTQDAVDSAWGMFLEYIGPFHERGRLLDIFGKRTPACKARSQMLDRIIVRMANAYKFVQSCCEFERSKKTDYNPAVPNVFGFGSAVDAEGKKRDGCPELFEELLAFASRKNLRRSDCTVYQEQYTHATTWVPPAGLKCSALDDPDHEGVECEGLPAYGVDEKDRWCLAFAKLKSCRRSTRATFVPHVRNVVYCSHVRTGTASSAKPAWNEDIPEQEKVTALVGSKTWVQRMVNGNPQQIKDLVMEVLDTRHGAKSLRWRMFAESFQNNFNNCAKYLGSTTDASFPVHAPRWNLYSFSNGMYNIETNEFYEYGSTPLDWTCGLNFIPQYFDPFLTHQELDEIRVPGYDDILATQRFDRETIECLDMFLGRLFFPLGKRDEYQRAVVLQGTGATGKSTIAKAVMNIMGERNIGQIPSNAEEQWALATVYNKYMWMCTEMKASFRLSMSVLQCMISGDPVTVHAKYKDAVDIPQWRTHGLLIGNELPTSWKCDVGGALTRRIVVFLFSQKPERQTASTQTALNRNLAPFLARTVRRYHAWTEGGAEELKLPAKVREFQAVIADETSLPRKFLREANCPVKIADVNDRLRLFHHVLMEKGENVGIMPSAFRTLAIEKRILLENGEKGDMEDISPVYGGNKAWLDTHLPALTLEVSELQRLYSNWKKDLDRSLRAPPLDIGAVDQLCNDENLLRIDKYIYGLETVAII